MPEKSFVEVVADLLFQRQAYAESGLTAGQYLEACDWGHATEADVHEAVNLLGIGDKDISTGGNVLQVAPLVGAPGGGPLPGGGGAGPGLGGGPGPGLGGGGGGGGTGGGAHVQPNVLQTINYYQQYVTNEDNDTVVDSSVNTVIQADPFSTVALDIDSTTTTASGDGAVAAGGNVSGAATGAGAVAAGHDIEDSAVNTGTFTGSQVGDFGGGGNLVSTVGDGNISAGDDIQDTNIAQDGSQITSINDSENVAFGDGSSVDDSINQTQDIDQTQVLVDQEIDQDNDLIDIDAGGRGILPGNGNGGLVRPFGESELQQQHQDAQGFFRADEGPGGDQAAFEGAAQQDQEDFDIDD